jgi:hypothetical protein
MVGYSQMLLILRQKRLYPFTRGDRDADITGTSLPDMNNATLSATGTVVTGCVLLTRILHQGKRCK